MPSPFNENTTSIIADTLDMVAEHRVALAAAMTPVMAKHGPYDPSAGRHGVTARSLTRMLLSHAEALAETGAMGYVDEAGREHLTLDIVGPHYSAFGNALRSTLKDLLGGAATPALLAAWDEIYWAIAHRMIERNAFVDA